MRRWLRDWHTGAALAAAVLVGLLAVLVITSISDREHALEVARRATVNEQAERAVLNHRIDQLLTQVSDLQDDAHGNAEQLIVLRREVALLQQQVRDLGGQPVVTGNATDGTTATTRQPQASPTAHPSPTRTPNPRPTPAPSPSPSPSQACIVITCRPGNTQR